MLRLTEIRLPIDHPEGALRAAILKRLDTPSDDLTALSVFRRAVDARKPGIVFTYTVDVEVRNEAAGLKRLHGDRHVGPAPDTRYRFPVRAPGSLATRPVVVGSGPCGFFAGLLLAQMGFRPIILERGKAVRERTRDTWGLWRGARLDPESNVQFGEGGAGTFSDGKLYSQVKDPRHLGRKVLTELVKAGAPEEILFVAKPHIGTFRLVAVVESLRETIHALGGEIRFQHRVVDVAIDDGQVRGIVLAGGQRIATDHVVLAVGHSARDTFQTLYDRGVHIEAKPFSIGLRIEHPQSLVDRARYGKNAGHALLGAADYKLVHHARNGRSVYSFCMCPGGTVVAAASEPGRVVTNGMSQYSRNERNANSGIVVGITPADYPGHPLAGIAFQRRWEEQAYEAGGSNYDAPAQRVADFLAQRPSSGPGSVVPSYTPGVRWTDLAACIPGYAVEAIREALPAFEKSIRGYAMGDAVLTGVETRTSSPISIRRGRDYQSVNTRGLYPAGEGAGYAGGILSAAIDGIEVAEAVALEILEEVMKYGDELGRMHSSQSVGGGPAGLMAAEAVLEGAEPGTVKVDLYDAMPSVGRKFLLAGKGGLNLTHSETSEAFLDRYGAARERLAPLLARFDADALRAWARALGIETFVGSSGRVFPAGMKAAPLLRAWLARLRAAGLTVHARHRWRGWSGDALRFDTPRGERIEHADAVVLAVGGGSWPQLGSDGAWVPFLEERGISVSPLRPANCGFDVRWSDHLRTRFAGAPVKTVVACFTDGAGYEHRQAGEFVIAGTGVEGGVIYGLSTPLRERISAAGPALLHVDLAPGRDLPRLAAELAHPRGRRSLSSHIQSRVGLKGAKMALLREIVPAADFADPQRLAAAIKALPLELVAPRPVAEAISTAGGVAFEALDEHLMSLSMPGVFCAGEMLDWEAPTGGYLLAACFATGRAAGTAALHWLRGKEVMG